MSNKSTIYNLYDSIIENNKIKIDTYFFYFSITVYIPVFFLNIIGLIQNKNKCFNKYIN